MFYNLLSNTKELSWSIKLLSLRCLIGNIYNLILLTPQTTFHVHFLLVCAKNIAVWKTVLRLYHHWVSRPCLKKHRSTKISLYTVLFLKVMGVQSDLLFPVQQQRDLEELLKESGTTNSERRFYRCFVIPKKYFDKKQQQEDLQFLIFKTNSAISRHFGKLGRGCLAWLPRRIRYSTPYIPR